MATDQDYLEPVGALLLVGKIQEYWRRRGHPELKVWAEPILIDTPGKRDREQAIYQVRSELVNGRPPKQGKNHGRSHDEGTQLTA